MRETAAGHTVVNVGRRDDLKADVNSLIAVNALHTQYAADGSAQTMILGILCPVGAGLYVPDSAWLGRTLG